MVPTPLDWAWAAGFIDGEGCILLTRNSPRVTACQKDRELLDRLLALFGGTVRQQVKGRKTPIWVWGVNGKQAVAVMQGIYPMLSTRRRERVDLVLRGA
jgi:hypothetical protein